MFFLKTFLSLTLLALIAIVHAVPTNLLPVEKRAAAPVQGQCKNNLALSLVSALKATSFCTSFLGLKTVTSTGMFGLKVKYLVVKRERTDGCC